MIGPYEAEDEVSGRYKISGFVGEGGMQYVYQATDIILGRDVALKTPKVVSAEKRFHRSAVVSARVNHPNVAKTLDYFEHEGRAYLIEELVDGLDLDKAILSRCKYLDPFLAARLFHHLAKGLAASHHANVIHRDLKPTNIMISGGFQLNSIKITDFGIAKMAHEEIAEAAEGGEETISTSQTVVGALPYMAPEAISSPRDVTLKVDVWSLGAMMYEILTGSKPFGTGLRAVAAILEAKQPIYPDFLVQNTQFSVHTRPLMDIISLCLSKSPDARPTADQLVSKCGELCYPVSERKIGYVRTYNNNYWGFIRGKDGTDVFFHKQSVYGAIPLEGQSVLFSEYSGGRANRAYPVISLD